MTPKTPASLLLAAVVAFAILLLAIPVRADLPVVVENQDASRTITWNTTTATGFVLQNASLAGGRAVLAWQTASVSWPTANQFLSNGTADANVSVLGSGLELRADVSNHVANGDFETDSNWSFSAGAKGNVTAAWDATGRQAVLGHASSAASETPWDKMDSLANWMYSASANVTGGSLTSESALQREGAGALNVTFAMGSGQSLYAGAVRSSAVNWSINDRLLIWVRTFSVSAPLSFNVTAQVNGGFRTTTAQPLALGWQELVVDLDELGPAVERSALQFVLLRINGQNVPTTSVYFDDARLANAKVFTESAIVSQAFVKENATTQAMGSAILAFDWVVPDAAGVQSVSASVGLNGPSVERTFAAGPSGSWQSLVLDVSPWASAAGAYTLAFRFEVAVDNTSASSAHVRIDNVSVTFPNRRNGTYLSDAVPLGVASQFPAVTWTASIPASTSVLLGLRSGNNSSPTSASWSSWETWPSPGTYSVSLPGARYVQVRVELGTTNASLSPRMSAMVLETRHRAAEGSVIADVFHVAGPDFLGWRSFAATSNRSVGTSIAFYVGDGSYWTPVPLTGTISGFAGTNISWKAVLQTVDGLQTPAVSRVDVVYEYLGEIVNVFITPFSPPAIVSGSTFKFQARAADAGNHTVSVPLFTWDTDDRTGQVLNDGTYVAGTPGPHNVTAAVPGLGIFGTVRVTVIEKPPLPAQLEFLPYALAVVAVIGLAYGAYEFAIRRMFAIDDVFLISRDGRLIMHNTRRMRADRDEDILTGMLTAILSFVRDADPEEDGDLRRFELGGKTTLLERGQNVFVSAVYSGRVPRWAAKDLRRFVADLETRFGEAFAKWTGAREDLPDLKEATHRFVSRVRYRSARKDSGRSQ